MRGRATTSLETMRRSRAGVLGAVLLIVLQVVLATDHLGAVAARATGRVVGDEALGLLSLCVGRDESPLGLHRTGNPADRSRDCVLCSLAALASHGVAASAPIVAAPALVLAALPAVVTPDTVVDRRPRLRHGTLRGPPVRS